jgi:cold shock CspA family protein
MSTMSFRDAMAGFSDVLYARAMEHMADKSSSLLGAEVRKANARAKVSFEVKLGKGGMANLSVSRYCTGFTLHCNAWIGSLEPGTVVAGHIHSSDGGGKSFSNLHAGQRIQFDLKTGFWSSTMFTLHLRTTPVLPEGTVLKVHMEIDY